MVPARSVIGLEAYGCFERQPLSAAPDRWRMSPMTDGTRLRMPRALRRMLFAAASLALAAAVVGASGSPAPGGLIGFWKSDGYGYVFDAKGERLQAYEVTRTTCVRSFEAKART